VHDEALRRDTRQERHPRGERAALHPALRTAFDALNSDGVRWSLMRLPLSLSAPTGDVDLLVDRADYARTGRILRTLGFGTLPVWGRGPDPEAFYLLYHEPSGHALCLHVVTEVSFGSGHRIATGTAAGCLQRRRKRGAVFEPDRGDAFWITLLHCLLDKGGVPPRYRPSLGESAASARTDDELAGVAEALCPAGWDASKMIDHVTDGDWPPLDRLARDTKDPEARRQPLDRALQSASTLLAVSSSRRVRRYALQKARTSILGLAKTDERPRGPASAGRGLTVALLGPDGVGKSTLAANLAVSLPGFGGVRMLYMGLGYGGLPGLARLPVPGSLAAIGLVTLWWRYLLALYHKRRGRLVVFDRYTYDAWLPPHRRLSPPQRLARSVWAHACPAPDLVFLLDAPGGAVYERRGGSEPPLLEAARQDFLSLRGRIPQLQLIDASRPVDAVREDVADRIYRHVRANGGPA
jgi:thymidylate kinase